jgi:hypothetical protein
MLMQHCVEAVISLFTSGEVNSEIDKTPADMLMTLEERSGRSGAPPLVDRGMAFADNLKASECHAP